MAIPGCWGKIQKAWVAMDVSPSIIFWSLISELIRTICFSNLQYFLLGCCLLLSQRKEDVCFNRFEFYQPAYLHQSIIIINYSPNK